MKRNLTILFVVVFAFQSDSKAQDYSYIAFPDSNAEWDISGKITPRGYTMYYCNHLYFDGDTTLDNKSYRMLYNNKGCSVAYPELMGYIRTDTFKRTFFRFANTFLHDEWDHLIYDFSLKKGDVIKDSLKRKSPSDTLHLTISVDSVDTVFVGNFLRKRFYVKGFGSIDTWIEGVGSLTAPYAWRTTFNFDFADAHLCRYMLDSLTIYQSYNSRCFFVSGVDETETSFNIHLFPNPASSDFQLKLSQNPQSQTWFRLYDALGRMVNQQILTGTNITIIRDGWQEGIYVWEVATSDRMLGRGKVVVH